MLKQTIWASIAVFIVLSMLDFIIHEIFLKSSYQETANLWRPEDEINMSVASVVALVFSICFVSIYSYLIESKSLVSGIKFGVLFGLAVGVSMGFGSYCYMPIPLSLALSWFFASLVELAIAGIMVGFIVKVPK